MTQVGGASLGWLSGRAGRGSGLRFRDGQGARPPGLPGGGVCPPAPPRNPGRPAVARPAGHGSPRNLRQALSYVRQALRRLAVAPQARTRPAGSGPPALPSGHPHRRAVQYGQRPHARRGRARGIRAAPVAATTAAPGAAQLLPEALCADFLAGDVGVRQRGVSGLGAGQAGALPPAGHRILDEQNATFEGSGDYERAAAAARAATALEPWLEEAHQRCMRALALAGRRDEALHQYELCCRALQAELGVEPGSEHEGLYADIRAGRLVAASAASVASAVGRDAARSPSPLPPVAPSLRPRPRRLVAGRTSWAASAAAWRPPWPARRWSLRQRRMRAAARRPCSKPLPLGDGGTS